MLSRVADSVFWMARYVERAENVARFIDVNHNLTLDLGEELGDQWAPLVYTTGDDAPFFKKYREASRENVLQFLTFDAENPNSILSCISYARENARTAREIISSDMWEELNRFYLLVRDGVRDGAQSDYEFFAQIKRASHLLIGTTDATMSHNRGWHFANLGRLLERADKTSRILDVKYITLLPHLQDVGTEIAQPLGRRRHREHDAEAAALQTAQDLSGAYPPARVDREQELRGYEQQRRAGRHQQIPA